MEQAKIQLAPYSAAWPGQFEIEARALREVLAPWLAGDIQHIGSTAVPGLSAKPVIDIMAPVCGLVEALPAIEALSGLNYLHFPYKREEMLWLCKPSPLHRTHHLHLVPIHSALWHRRLVFRDALRCQAALASEYETLKARLAAEHPHDREAYTEGKSMFIQSVLAAESPGVAQWPASRQAPSTDATSIT
jgi:GrpB-like predicted nucleotidyltransferase (UPF0157 family)